MKVNAFIIDDERKAISILKNKICRIDSDIQITGEFQYPMEALSAIEKNKPDLIFLDITMPEMNGFELLEKLSNLDFEVIFVTAYGDYAIEAIRRCAIGYVMKPIVNDDLKIALENAKRNIDQKTALQKNRHLVENMKVPESGKKKIAIPSAKGLDFVEIENIIRCEGTNGYTVLHIKNQIQFVSSYSIGYFCKILESLNFYLIHKSHLINLNCLQKYDRSGYVELAEQHNVPVARNRREAFLERIENS